MDELSLAGDGLRGTTDAAAVRLKSTKERLTALRERVERLQSGMPVTLADVVRARAWAAAQSAETREAFERLKSTHRAAAERQYAAAEVLARAGRLSRAERLLSLAAQHEDAASSAQQALERQSEQVRPADEQGHDWPAEAFPSDIPLDSLPPFSALRRTLAENQRLRALTTSVATAYSTHGRATDERRRRLWKALADCSGSANWQGWSQAACQVATAWLPTVDGTAISLLDDAGPSPLAAWERWAENLEELQVVIGDGPAVSAHRAGKPVIVPDLDAERDRWPGFVGAAARTGLNSLWALPLRVGDVPLGVVTFYRRVSGSPSRPELLDAAAVVELATAAVIGDADELDRSGILVGGSAFGTVHIATGIIATRLGISTDEAMARLRAHAFGSGQRLRTVAEWVVHGTIPAL